VKSDADTPIRELVRQVLEFRDARDWRQYHHPKDLAMALAIEAGELMEPFRFKSPEQIDAELAAGGVPEVAHEMADVLYFLLLFAHELGVDLTTALAKKLALNAEKYPVELCRGRNLKYTQL